MYLYTGTCGSGNVLLFIKEQTYENRRQQGYNVNVGIPHNGWSVHCYGNLYVDNALRIFGDHR